jgi:transposase
MEATGTYANALAEYLHTAGHRVSVVNPAVIQAYGRSRLTRNKTDALDADLIARYCLKEQPPAWEPDPPEVRELQALVRRLEALRTTHTQELNRLQAGVTSPMVLTSLRESLTFLEQQMHTLEALIGDHIDQHPALKRQDELLRSIPGIGPAVSAHLLAIRLERFDDARAAAAYAGLNPALRQSGVFKGQSRLSKLGDAAIRAKLYLPALTAIRFNPLIAAQAQRLAERGKCSMVIISAAMHKLIRLAYGVLKSGRPFDPNYAHRLTTP